MKAIKVLLVSLVFGFSARAQFTNTDSIRNYIDKYIRSSAVNAFQNNRLNTALKGLANMVDSLDSKLVGGVRVVDSIWQPNDTTLAYKIKGDTYYLEVSGGSGVQYSPSTGISINNNTIAAQTTAPIWNANKVLGLTVDTVGKGNNYSLVYDSVNSKFKLSKVSGSGGAIYTGNSGSGLIIGGDIISIDTTTKIATKNDLINIQLDSTDILIDGETIKSNAGTLYATRPYPVINSAPEFRTSALVTSGSIIRLKKGRAVLDYMADLTDNSTADDSVTTLINGGVRYKLVYNQRIFIEDFGAIANDNIDDSYAIQKAINFAMAQSDRPIVTSRYGGTMNVKNLRAQKLSGTSEQFHGITISGPIAPYAVNTGGLEFKKTISDGAILFIERGRSVTISNIIFTGPGPSLNSVFKDVVEWTDSQWLTSAVDGSAMRNNRYSPSALLVIDGLASQVTNANRYPNIPSTYYSDNAVGGTSNVTINDCVFRNDNVGVMVGPTGYTGNGDNIKANNTHWYDCRVAWGVGTLQARANQITNTYSFDIKRFIDCRTYGQQLGAAPAVNNFSINICRELYSANTPHAAMSWSAGHVELLWRLGDNDDVMPVNFKDVDIHLAGDEYDVFAPNSIAGGGPLSIDGGMIRAVDNSFNALLPFNVSNLEISNATLSSNVPFITNQYGFDKVVLRNVSFNKSAGTYSQLGTLDPNLVLDNMPVATFKNLATNLAVMKGTKFTTQTGMIQYEVTGPVYDRLLITAAAVFKIDTATHTGYILNNGYGAKFRQGDGLVASNSVSGITYGNVGTVQRVSGDSVFINNIPYGVSTSTTYTIYILRVPEFMFRAIATVTNGSTTLTDVTGVATQYPAAGDLIKGAGIPAGARVTSVNEGAKTIEISVAATADGTRVELYDAELTATGNTRRASNAMSVANVWYTGDEVQSGSSGSPYGWKVSRPGLVGDATYPPTFTPLITDAMSASGNNYLTGFNLFQNKVSIGSLAQAVGTVDVVDSVTTTAPTVHFIDKNITMPNISAAFANPSLAGQSVGRIKGISSGSYGGLSVSGLSSGDGDLALLLNGYSGKTGALDTGVVRIALSKWDGTSNRANLATTDAGLDIFNGSHIFQMLGDGSIKVGGTAPTAMLHLPAGTTTRAPFKLTAGTNLTTPQAGAIEFDGTHYYGTIGTTRYQLDQQGGGGGTGTVTDFSAGNLSPLFTTTEATTTTTPALSFTLSNAAANSIFGNFTGTSAAPTFFVPTGTPSATTYLRGDGTWATPAGGGSGTVTSVAATVPGWLSVTGSPITTTGTLAISANTQTANTILAGPTTGSAAAPTFRALTDADMPPVLLLRQTIANPTGTFTVNVNNGGQAYITITSTGTRTLAFSNLAAGHMVKLYFYNSSGSSITLGLPGVSYVQDGTGSQASVTLPIGRSVMTLVDYDGSSGYLFSGFIKFSD